MTRFFFDLRADARQHRDIIGEDLPSLAAARAQALQVAAAYAGGSRETSDGGAIIVEVRNESDTLLLTIRLVFSVEAH